MKCLRLRFKDFARGMLVCVKDYLNITQTWDRRERFPEITVLDYEYGSQIDLICVQSR